MAVESDYHHKNLKMAVIEHAAKTLEEKGESEISLRQIAREIGVSHQAPYRHFSKKQDVIAAVQSYGFRRLAEETREAAAKHPRSKKLQLEAATLRYVKHAVERPALYNLMFGGNVHYQDWTENQKLDARDAFFALAEIFEGGDREEVSKESTHRAHLVWSFLHGVASLWNSGFLRDEGSVDSFVKSGLKSLFADWFK